MRSKYEAIPRPPADADDATLEEYYKKRFPYSAWDKRTPEERRQQEAVMGDNVEEAGDEAPDFAPPTQHGIPRPNPILSNNPRTATPPNDLTPEYGGTGWNKPISRISHRRARPTTARRHP